MSPLIFPKLFAVIGAALFFAASSRAQMQAPFQDQEHYERAVRGGLSASELAPGATVITSLTYYVLVTIVDDRTHTSARGCVPVYFLEGALRMEHGSSAGDNEQYRLEQIVLNQQDHVFHFWNRRALENVELDYTPQELVQARRALAPYSREQLLDPSIWQHGRLLMLSSATICALIERGLTGLRGDWPNMVLVEP